MAEWNPNSTGTKGLEWLPYQEGVTTLDAANKMAAMSLVQTASQTIGGVRVPVASPIGVRGGLYAVEVYDNESAVAANVTTLQALPNEDVSGFGNGFGEWQGTGNDITNLFEHIDDNVVEVDWIVNQGGGANVKYYSRFNTGSLSLTGKRILSVTLQTRMQRYFFDGNTLVYFGLNLSGVDYGQFYATPYGQYATLTKTWLYNPATKKPWTIAQVQALDTTDEWFIAGNGTPDGTVIVYWVHLDIAVCDENRIAVGTLDDTASGLTAGAWNEASMLTPTGGAWTKDGTGRHLYTVRRISSEGSVGIPHLEAVSNPSIATGYAPTVDPTYGHVTVMGDPTTRLIPILQRTTAPADSVDSQPYADLLAANVFTGQDAEMEFSGAAATAYAVVRFLVKPASETTTANLVVTLKRRSDNAVMGAALTLTRAQIVAYPAWGPASSGGTNGYYLVEAQLPTPATLAGATQYYTEFSSSAASSSVGWIIAALDTLNQGNTATFGGTTDRALVNTSEADRYDLPTTMGTVPVAPANFAATAGTDPISQTLCCIATLGVIDLTWDATALGGAFGRYEIERSEDAGATWEPIYWITTEATTSISDFEARRGVATRYRIRVIRNDAATSVYATSSDATKTVPSDDHVLYLVSNFDPAYNIAYDYEPVKGYDFPTDAEIVTVPIHGRDKQLGFIPTEDRGVIARYTILVALDDRTAPGGGQGFNAFTPLIDIATAPLPYVCVLDHYGNRQYALLRVPHGDESQAGFIGRYVSEFSAIDVPGPFVVGMT